MKETIMSAKELSGRVALVTGGSRSMGAAIARRLAFDGASVALTFHQSEDRASSVVEEIEAEGGRAIAVRADSGTPGDVRAAVARTVKVLGSLDILVNSAGTIAMAPIEEFSFAEYERMVAVNITGTFIATKEAVAHMKAGGRIINIGSVMPRYVGFANFSVYALTKGAIHGFTRGLARDLGPKGITANVVMPGPIDTDMNPSDGPFGDVLREKIALGRYGESQEIADIVAFLASSRSAFVTGAEIVADGGMSA
ncbi:SDR family NAD(P)-dependent oxidoreductase [Ensifer adhaerens]|uniref:3-oxoacyl-ACP reductase FabG n=1 Tax=Ensifer adhaerens TaxID=106592 RepID=A0A9Q8YGX4_ENSAD|nr:3-oxoacyl-ACP reductase family protein [Ensifer adhaerens]USJ28503.1 3-oxoacyl-ACP reductase FabG [Ensifer adhaerens]